MSLASIFKEIHHQWDSVSFNWYNMKILRRVIIIIQETNAKKNTNAPFSLINITRVLKGRCLKIDYTLIIPIPYSWARRVLGRGERGGQILSGRQISKSVIIISKRPKYWDNRSFMLQGGKDLFFISRTKHKPVSIISGEDFLFFFWSYCVEVVAHMMWEGASFHVRPGRHFV